ncbi:MAG: sulfurtransferase TusA family protein, partial [Planctomycetes bacterium]|nr:sulfurtransferase TusA family protein [Planctomycetota bacterium]
MDESIDLKEIKPDRVFDGGDLDCGSGLVLLLRDNMAKVPVGGILEMRSREPTVGDDLPPWCRLTNNDFLGALEGQGHMRYFLRRGEPAEEETQILEEDKEKAKAYSWRLR